MTTPYVDPNTVHVPSTGSTIPAAWGSTVRDDLQFFSRPPMVKVERTAAQSIATSTATAVEFTAADVWDTDAFHDPTVNPSRVVIPAGHSGRFLITAHARFAASSAGIRRLAFIAVGGSTIEESIGESNPKPSPSTTRVNSNPVILALNAGQHVELHVFQDSGGSLDVEACTMSLTFVSL